MDQGTKEMDGLRRLADLLRQAATAAAGGEQPRKQASSRIKNRQRGAVAARVSSELRPA
jgi:hypothetical protein